MFEKLERLDTLLSQHHWQWILRWHLPLHSIGRLLTKLSDLLAYADAERAWRQVDVILRRHNNEDFSMANVPAWRVVERLCDQAMLAHSSRAHAGCSYATRLATDMVPLAEAGPLSPVNGLSNNMADVTCEDAEMFHRFWIEGTDMLFIWITLNSIPPDSSTDVPSQVGFVYCPLTIGSAGSLPGRTNCPHLCLLAL